MAPLSFSGKKPDRSKRRPDSKRTDSKRPDSKRTDSKRPDSKRSDSKRSGTARPDSRDGKRGFKKSSATERGARSDRAKSDRPRTDKPKTDGARPDRAKPDRRKPELKERQDRRFREFAVPPLPIDITGEELDKKRRFQLQPLALENAEVVAKHLVAIERFLESDPEMAYRHGQEATYRAGRIAIVRELAGLAALRSGRYEIAQKDLRAASRISGSKEILPFIAQCEVALGHPRKALEIAGSVDARALSAAGRVELRIAAAAARSALDQFDAAVVTLRCEELNESDASWSPRLRTAYYKALLGAGRMDEASNFKERYPQSIMSEAI